MQYSINNYAAVLRVIKYNIDKYLWNPAPYLVEWFYLLWLTYNLIMLGRI
jgi:hypothetical protein